jgi:hypothetical protein
MKKLVSLAVMILMLGGTVILAQSEDDSADAEAQALESYVQMVKGDLKAKRDSALKTLLVMTEEQRAVFDPLKQQYDEERGALRESQLALVRKFMAIHDQLTLESSSALADQFFALDEEVIQLRRKYFQLMSEEIGAVTAVQFLQLQGQFETMADLKLATAAPLAVE